MDSLSSMNDRLRRIFRGAERYGDGTPAEQARRYRMTEMLPVTVRQAVDNSSYVLREPIDLLISLSGFSPETTIFAFELLRPPRLMIIGSDSTRASVDVIQAALGLPHSRLDVQYVDPSDPMKIYQVIQEAVRRGDGQRNVVIDITGGKKVMSASAALAAAQLDLPMCYIDSKFDPELRVAVPGTERLVILPNPTVLFGDRELDAALVAFRHGAYAAARERFAAVADTANEPTRARFLRDLSDVYQVWCDLDFAALGGKVEALRGRMTNPAYRPPTTVVEKLEHQVRFLASLSGTSGPELSLCFYLLGEHYRRLGRHYFAALMFYRTLESGFAQRLAAVGPGFFGSRPDYRLLADDPADLTAQYVAAARQVHGRNVSGLPVTVGLMDAALLLHVLSDPLLECMQLRDEKGLLHLKGTIQARNKSVLAHGTDTVDEKLCAKLGNLAHRGLRALWALTFDGADVDRQITVLRFLIEV